MENSVINSKIAKSHWSLIRNWKLEIKNSRQRRLGFTLVEILVVIVIMAILASIGMVSYNGAGKKSRDAKRIKDLEQIKFALESYRADNFVYPGVAGTVYKSCGSGDWPPPDTEDYFKSNINDPKNQEPYCYYYEASADKKDYELDALLEIDNADENDNGNFGTVYEVGTDLEIDPYVPGASPSPSPSGSPSPSPETSPSPSPSPSPLESPSPSPSPSISPSPSPSPSPSAPLPCPAGFRCCDSSVSYCSGIEHPEYECANPFSICCEGLCRVGQPTE